MGDKNPSVYERNGRRYVTDTDLGWLVIVFRIIAVIGGLLFLVIAPPLNGNSLPGFLAIVAIVIVAFRIPTKTQPKDDADPGKRKNSD